MLYRLIAPGLAFASMALAAPVANTTTTTTVDVFTTTTATPTLPVASTLTGYVSPAPTVDLRDAALASLFRGLLERPRPVIEEIKDIIGAFTLMSEFDENSTSIEKRSPEDPEFKLPAGTDPIYPSLPPLHHDLWKAVRKAFTTIFESDPSYQGYKLVKSQINKEHKKRSLEDFDQTSESVSGEVANSGLMLLDKAEALVEGYLHRTLPKATMDKLDEVVRKQLSLHAAAVEKVKEFKEQADDTISKETLDLLDKMDDILDELKISELPISTVDKLDEVLYQLYENESYTEDPEEDEEVEITTITKHTATLLEKMDAILDDLKLSELPIATVDRLADILHDLDESPVLDTKLALAQKLKEGLTKANLAHRLTNANLAHLNKTLAVHNKLAAAAARGFQKRSTTDAGDEEAVLSRRDPAGTLTVDDVIGLMNHMQTATDYGYAAIELGKKRPMTLKTELATPTMVAMGPAFAAGLLPTARLPPTLTTSVTPTTKSSAADVEAYIAAAAALLSEFAPARKTSVTPAATATSTPAPMATPIPMGLSTTTVAEGATATVTADVTSTVTRDPNMFVTTRLLNGNYLTYIPPESQSKFFKELSEGKIDDVIRPNHA